MRAEYDSMAIPPFDASKAVTFDLERGQLRLGDSPPGVLVPAKALAELCAAAGDDAADGMARALGESIGVRVAGRLAGADGGARGAPVEAFIEHLAGELSLGGIGSLGAERWGRALLLVVDHCPFGAAGDRLVASLLGAAICTATTTDARCVLLARDGDRTRFLVTGREAADKVTSWLGSGVGWGEALVRLHGASAGGAP
jgi:hypothetical protein